MKVTIVGAGNVGASCAEYILIKEIVDEIVLLDIKEGFAEARLLIYLKLPQHLALNQKLLELQMTISALLIVML